MAISNNKQTEKEKEVPADVMEGGERVKGNKAYEGAKERVVDSFNPLRPRTIDNVAMTFVPQHVFYKNPETGEASLIFPAGSYVSNVEKLLMDEQLKDTEFQKKQLEQLADAGYVNEVEEGEVEAKILA